MYIYILWVIIFYINNFDSLYGLQFELDHNNSRHSTILHLDLNFPNPPEARMTLPAIHAPKGFMLCEHSPSPSYA